MDKQNKEEALLLLKDIINHRSVNPPGDEKVLADFIAKYLKDTVDEIVVDEIDENRANVIAIIKGNKNKKALVFNGHMDTVPYGDKDKWHYVPDKATIVGSRLYGRGASDMKSGLAALLYAFKQFSCSKKKPEGDIIFIGTADEESSGAGAYDISKKGYLDNAFAMVIGEPTNNSIALASKGTIWAEFEVFGKTSHSAYPWEGINAVEKGYELIDSIKALLNGHSHKYLKEPSCTITGINGGIKFNMVPDYCRITVDIRTVPSVNHNWLLDSIDNIINRLEDKYSGLKITKKIINNRQSTETDENSMIVQELKKAVEKVTGNVPCFSGTGYFSDASIFLLKNSIPTILFGPGLSNNAHKPDEYVEIESFYTAVECYKSLMSNY